jgi:hypothetical protein
VRDPVQRRAREIETDAAGQQLVVGAHGSLSCWFCVAERFKKAGFRADRAQARAPMFFQAVTIRWPRYGISSR